jgi:putative ABC transport system permease protein
MAITMVIVLIIAGALAGFIPAWKAAHIQPVKALSHE